MFNGYCVLILMVCLWFYFWCGFVIVWCACGSYGWWFYFTLGILVFCCLLILAFGFVMGLVGLRCLLVWLFCGLLSLDLGGLLVGCRFWLAFACRCLCR